MCVRARDMVAGGCRCLTLRVCRQTWDLALRAASTGAIFALAAGAVAATASAAAGAAAAADDTTTATATSAADTTTAAAATTATATTGDRAVDRVGPPPRSTCFLQFASSTGERASTNYACSTACMYPANRPKYTPSCSCHQPTNDRARDIDHGNATFGAVVRPSSVRSLQQHPVGGSRVRERQRKKE